MRLENPDVENSPTLARHIGSLVGILVVSSIACSFPTASKRYSFLQLPSVIFFIGKHFGTGVILATAFVHLLTDAFTNLSHESVPGRWRGSAGAIVLVSLLIIFIIEYISTAYVERAESDNTPPHHEHGQSSASYLTRSETEPLLPEPTSAHTDSIEGSHLYGSLERHSHSHDASEILEGHTRYESLTRGPSSRHHHGRSGRLKTSTASLKAPVANTPPEPSEVGDSRQVVGILVLQVGIMLHSLVIGITLSITSGHEFTSLLIAVIFHQLFEGLSLGVRISSLPKALSGLRVLLCFLFAITMPIGIVIGLSSFAAQHHRAASHFAQGIMASTSAGLLIYASTVEMLAGDFVMEKEIKLGSVSKQITALGSVVLGAVAMGILGIWS